MKAAIIDLEEEVREQQSKGEVSGQFVARGDAVLCFSGCLTWLNVKVIWFRFSV